MRLAAIHRWLNIQGDPTLRLNPFRPPSNLGFVQIGGNLTLHWSGRGSQYYVYRAANPAGPYTLLTTNPLQTATYTNTVSATDTNYMVRGMQLFTTGLCNYTNLSIGLMGHFP